MEDIIVEVYTNFKELYTKENLEEEGITKELLINMPTLITLEDNKILTMNIEESKFIEAILGLELDKAPIPNGFTIHLM